MNVFGLSFILCDLAPFVQFAKVGEQETTSCIFDAWRSLVPFYNLKNVKNTHGGVLLLVKLQTETCNATKSNTLPLVFLMFFKL